MLKRFAYWNMILSNKCIGGFTKFIMMWLVFLLMQNSFYSMFYCPSCISITMKSISSISYTISGIIYVV